MADAVIGNTYDYVRKGWRTRRYTLAREYWRRGEWWLELREVNGTKVKHTGAWSFTDSPCWKPVSA